jgi:hypothetical protein
VARSNRWDAILSRAVEIVESYDTGVTLRQLFYRLVAAQLLRNTRSEYGQLSARTAQARREGWFPALIDRTREIEIAKTFISPEEAREYMQSRYYRDRTEGQEYSLYLAVEKAGIVNQLWSWFSSLGIPILPLQGYSSQSFVDEVAEHVFNWRANMLEGSTTKSRPAVLIYAGDFDPSGEDIDRDFEERTGCWEVVHRIALLPEQIEQYSLPPAMGKATDSRAQAFIDRHGELVQVELDALPPDILQGLYRDQINEYFDHDVWQAVVEQEAEERDSLGS